MTASVDFTAPEPSQAALRGILRGALTLLFRGLMRPPLPVPLQRAILRGLTASTLAPRGVTREAAQLAGRPCEWHRPPGGGDAVLLYLHGGAFITGSPATHRAIAGNLAKRAGIDVCALEYRLAPEHPFPAGRDDAVAAYQALLERGHAASRIVIGGDSAGGNLTLVTALRLRQLGLPAPAALVCYSPVTDLSGNALHQPPAGDPLIHPKWMELAADLYCPPGMERRDPALSPLFDDLGHLPPLLVQVAEDELLRDDSLRLVARLREAGSWVRLERYPGLWHVFQAHAGILRSADEALASTAGFIRHWLDHPQEG
ncbi:acetyl esterase/lipase [Pseudomonas sp. SLBN-26]|uniref:alpha/beta hydrolase n=1 Tax=Pseudomonadaceae TaxID=135621 RepID=UPI00114DE349|nr:MULTISPECIES: alpha/beta hydrolase [Pseudomonas]MCP1615700.1 acetyl esterase/lipase [Pseudomonas otitidis]TQL04970.1 acetyl esterase/lipase [Pseudomonas sp. SLBN-26]